MSTESESRCGDCRFYDKAIPSCRRHPPILHRGLSGWPVVTATDWCGEFKPADPSPDRASES